MKDLKHLTWFEDLLQDANNELIVQAQREGKKCVAYVCENTPEPLLNLDGIFSARLRAPRTGSMEMATYYLTSFLCEYSRALLERAIEGGYNFADCLIAPDGCTMINRAVENMELLHTMGKDKDSFFYENMEIPMKADDNGLNLFVLQCRNHILKPLEEKFGIDCSDSAIRKSVEEHNRVCSLIRAIGEFRKGERPTITGYEFNVITLATYVAPKYLLLDKLEETLEELKTREPDEKNAFRARVLIVGSEVDDPEFVKLVEGTGAFVCADRFCYGSFPGRDCITLTDDEDALTQICRQYMYRGQCPRYMDQAKMVGRREYVKRLAEEYAADGIIYEQIKFCDPWAYERMIGSHVLHNDFGYPVLSIDRPYSTSGTGQLRTRIQAFIESIEIKKIRGGV
ncbi:MAG: 2-hydroxyacyl-CoA dehydratase [Oscillospiraceae bacterium]|nr:2-hydroxyacyl-CoA dehydratase [Oscillospiraceae bacterium]